MAEPDILSKNNFPIKFFLILGLGVGLTATSAFGGDSWMQDDVAMEKVGNTLFLVLVLAILLETGLSTLFNWRIYLKYFEERGLKVPIAVASAFIFVKQFEIDAVAEILNAFVKADSDPGIAGIVLTALIIAGGSSAVFTLYEKLGIRNPLERRGVAAGMRQQCTLKIRLVRNEGQENKLVTVLIDEKMVGTINPNENKFGGLLGYTIEAGEHKIGLKSRGKDDNEINQEKTIDVAPGADITEMYKLTATALVL